MMQDPTQKAESQLKQLIAALKSENKRLQKQVAKYQAQCISLQNKVVALEAEIRKRPNLAELLAGIDSPNQKPKGAPKR